MSCLLLHVDDNRDDLTLLRDAFREHGDGVRVESSPSATAAMSFLAREVPFADTALPDLILIDVYMPLIGGIQFLRILKETPDWAAIPAVMFAASGRSRERDECRQLGAAGFIIKPPDWQGYASFAAKLAREIRNGRLNLVATRIPVTAEEPGDDTPVESDPSP